MAVRASVEGVKLDFFSTDYVLCLLVCG
jgi:hypothetical protein